MKCKHAFANNDGREWCDKHHIYELTEMDCKRCKLRGGTKTVKKAKRVNTSSIDISYLVSRKQRGLTYEQLGKEFGISQSTAYRLYNDYINQFNKKGDTK